MNVIDFCKFFNFSIEIISIDEVSEDAREEYDLQEEWVYEMVDDQGVFQTRYADNIADIADLFDSMLPDYVDSNLEEGGFTPDNYSETPVYEQAIEFFNGKPLEDSQLMQVVKVLADPSLLIDDGTTAA